MSAVAGIIGGMSPATKSPMLHQMMQTMAHRAQNGFHISAGEDISLAGTSKIDPRGSDMSGSFMYSTSLAAYEAICHLINQEPEPSIEHVSSCLRKLRGGFIVVFWFAKTRRALIVRDQIGLHPLYYGFRAGSFLFASEPQALLSLDEIPKELDYKSIAGNLTLQFADRESTNYRGLRRLPPAHVGIWDGQTFNVRRYWDPPVAGEFVAGTDKELYANARSLFLSSVERCISGNDNVAALLSGGLDSSAIVSAAVSLRRTNGIGNEFLPTFSAVFDNYEHLCERRYQDAVISQGGLSPTRVECSILPQFDGVDTWLERHAGNVSPAGYAMYERVLLAAGSAGHKILLDGAGGDEVIGYGSSRPMYLFKQHKWPELAWEMLRAGRGSASPFLHFLDTFMRYGPPASKRLGKLARIYPRLFPQNERDTKPQLVRRDLLNRDFVSTYKILELEENERQKVLAFKTEQEEHLNLVFNNLQTSALEYVDRQIWAQGMEPRFPFWDLDLVEFCVKTPSDLKYKFGVGRLLTRIPMKGLLPEAVRLRTDKMDFTPFNRDGMLLEGLDRLQAQLEVIYATLGDIFDVNVVKSLFTRFTIGPDALWPGDVQHLFAVLTMGRFIIAERGGPKLPLGS